MEGVKKFFFSSTKTGKEIKMTFDNRAFSLKRIKVLSCESFSDCNYIETVLFTFNLCEEKAPYFINGADIDIQFNLEIEINTGYLPEDSAARDLRKILSPFKIVKINELINAFAYRKYYNEI